MSRIVDEPYFTYSAYNALTSGIQVKCPKCHGAGMVTADDDNAYFRCLSCGHQETRDRTIYRYDVHNQCKNCGRYYRVDIEDEEKQHFSVLHVACPYCGTTMSGEVHKTAEAFSYTAEIQDGREPYFGLELWFLTSFQGKPAWALNREHLAYLIDYLSAGLREKPHMLACQIWRHTCHGSFLAGHIQCGAAASGIPLSNSLGHEKRCRKNTCFSFNKNPPAMVRVR